MSDNTYVNALVGAAVTVVFSFTGLSPLLGGAAAGYLERRDGGRVGALSGAFATVPVLALVAVGGLLVGFLGFGVPVVSGAVVLVLLVLVLGVYVVGLSAVGGVLGVYLAEEFRD